MSSVVEPIGCCARAAPRCATVKLAGLDPTKLRLVPLGVDLVTVTEADVERVRRRYRLPTEFVLFVGTLEPRKNLRRLAAAVGRPEVTLPLVVAGADGWGDAGLDHPDDALFIGFVPQADLAPLYAAATVFAYPSEREGFGLPVAEALSQGTAVVTSRDTSTEEVAGGAAVLVDPFDVDSIAAGLVEAIDRTNRTRPGRTSSRRRVVVGDRGRPHSCRLP